MVIPGHNIESQTESGKYHESFVETNVRDNINNLRYMVQAGEGEETLVPKRRSYTAISPGKISNKQYTHQRFPK